MTGIPAWRVVDGALTPVTLSHVYIGGSAVPILSKDQSKPLPQQRPDPVGITPRLGAYPTSGFNDDAAAAAFGHPLGISSVYYQFNQNSLNVAAETSKVNAGTSPLMTLTSKGTQTTVGLAGLDSSAANTAARDWMDVALAAAEQIAVTDPDVPVYFSYESEWEVKRQQGEITGGAADPATFGKALTWVFDRAAQIAPHVRLVWWVGGASARRPELLTVWQNIDAPFHVYGIDPYSQSGSNPAGTWATRIADARTGVYANEWLRLGTPAIGVCETGTNKLSQTDAERAAWVANLPAAMESTGVEFCVYFNSDSGSNGDWHLYSGTVPVGGWGDYPAKTAFGQALLEVNGR